MWFSFRFTLFPCILVDILMMLDVKCSLIRLLVVVLVLVGVVRTECFFSTSKLNGKYWIVDPTGSPHISIGVNSVSYYGDTIYGTSTSPYRNRIIAKYGSGDEGRVSWTNATVDRLKSWNFNSAGAWSTEDFWDRMPYTRVLDIATKLTSSNWLTGELADFFDPQFEIDVDNVRDCDIVHSHG